MPSKLQYEKAKASRRLLVCVTCKRDYVYPFGSTKKYCPNCYLKVKREKLKLKAVAYLGNECQECGYKKCRQALHFHHLRDKHRSISQMITRSYAWNRIQSELDKCILLCSNCHAEIHYGTN